MDNADNLRGDLIRAIAAAESKDALEAVRVSALGKKGTITQLMKTLGGMEPDARKQEGQEINALKAEVSAAIDERKTVFEEAELGARLMAERVDVSLPVRPRGKGSIHPISQVIEEMTAIFCEMGFTVAEGPDIEEDWYNFTALNIPPEHPARQEHDTFYLPGEKNGHRKVLRTHTSPVQIHTMHDKEPPIRIIVPGRPTAVTTMPPIRHVPSD